MQTTILGGELHVVETDDGKQLQVIPVPGIRYLLPMPQDKAEKIGQALIDRARPVVSELQGQLEEATDIERPQDVIDHG